MNTVNICNEAGDVIEVKLTDKDLARKLKMIKALGLAGDRNDIIMAAHVLTVLPDTHLAIEKLGKIWDRLFDKIVYQYGYNEAEEHELMIDNLLVEKLGKDYLEWNLEIPYPAVDGKYVRTVGSNLYEFVVANKAIVNVSKLAKPQNVDVTKLTDTSKERNVKNTRMEYRADIINSDGTLSSLDVNSDQVREALSTPLFKINNGTIDDVLKSKGKVRELVLVCSLLSIKPATPEAATKFVTLWNSYSKNYTYANIDEWEAMIDAILQ